MNLKKQITPLNSSHGGRHFNVKKFRKTRHILLARPSRAHISDFSARHILHTCPSRAAQTQQNLEACCERCRALRKFLLGMELAGVWVCVIFQAQYRSFNETDRLGAIKIRHVQSLSLSRFPTCVPLVTSRADTVGARVVSAE